MEREELEAAFVQTLRAPSGVASYPDRNVEVAIARLGLAVVRLDKTSGFLAKVNIVLGGLVFMVGVFQVILMLRGH